MVADLPKSAFESKELLMKRWLESIRDNERVVKVLTWVFAVTLIGFILVFISNDRSGEQKPFPTQLYYLFGLPSLALIVLFIALQRVEKKYLPPSTAEELEEERLRKETAAKTASEDYQLARQTEEAILELLKREGIRYSQLAQSPMAQDMAGLVYVMDGPLRLTKERFLALKQNRVLSIDTEQQGDVIVIRSLEISSISLHTYATFFVKPE
jgi:hypothetical protein